MARIHIKSDGSFEAIAAAHPNAARIKELNTQLTQAKKDVRVCKSIAQVRHGLTVIIRKLDELRSAGKKSTPEYARVAKKRDDAKAKVEKLKGQLSNPRYANMNNMQRHFDKLIDQIAAAKVPRNSPAANKAAAKKAVPRKVSFDVAAKRAAGQAVGEIKGELARLGKEALAPSKKPAAGVTKHAAPANSAIQGVLKVINQLKRDIAGGLTGTKLAHAKAELAKQRSSLRTLRKGQSAKNQAAVTKTPATKNMGKAKPKTAATTPVDLKALRATMTELHKKVMAEKDATKKAALEKRYKAAVAKFKKMRLVK